MKENLDTKTIMVHAQVDTNTISNFSSSVKLKYVKLGYHYLVSNVIYLLLTPIFITTFTHLISTLTLEDITQLWNLLRFNFVVVILLSGSAVFTLTLYMFSRQRKVYLVDFACYRNDNPERKITREAYMEFTARSNYFTEESLSFKRRIMEKSGYGQRTHAPKGLTSVPIDQSMVASREETEMIMFGAVDDLLAKTGVKPRDVDILIVNSSVFNPTPSLSAAIVNHYKLRGNILSYNLGGMGCSAGIISIDLAKDLLQVHANAYALVVSTENITRNWYTGNERSMLVTNCLFRTGGAAILLSNRSSDRRRSKYQLVHTVRTHKGADDESYNCILQKEDEKQIVGVSLSKHLVAVAGEALKANITTLGPLVLPVSEQLLFLATLIAKKIFKLKIKPYVPDFKLAFEHFCLHAGGRGVLDELEKSLKLSEWDMEPSRMTLYRFGNTSSSSLWYELAYCEAKGRVKRGHRVWQIGYGSGFKCNSAVWRAIRTIIPGNEQNPWMDEIDEFPVNVPKVAPIVYQR